MQNPRQSTGSAPRNGRIAGRIGSLGLLPAVARGGIEVVGVGVVPFPQVLKLHRTDPGLFRTGGVSFVVPGVGTVPATWCDGV